MKATLKNIKAAANAQGHTIQWLIDQLEMPKSTFYRRSRTAFKQVDILAISKILGVDFE